MRRVGILTISDRGAEGVYEDKSGPLAAGLVAERTGWMIARRSIIPDEFETIADTLREWCAAGLDLILTSGGTGLAESDVTPEATAAVIDREAPGIAEALRLASREHTKYWMMSRGIAGLRGDVLVINFPGNPRSIAEAGEPLLDTLEHAMALLLDRESGH